MSTKIIDVHISDVQAPRPEGKDPSASGSYTRSPGRGKMKHGGSFWAAPTPHIPR
jgi:hypothetical protein